MDKKIFDIANCTLASDKRRAEGMTRQAEKKGEQETTDQDGVFQEKEELGQNSDLTIQEKQNSTQELLTQALGNKSELTQLDLVYRDSKLSLDFPGVPGDEIEPYLMGKTDEAFRKVLEGNDPQNYFIRTVYDTPFRGIG